MEAVHALAAHALQAKNGQDLRAIQFHVMARTAVLAVNVLAARLGTDPRAVEA